MVHTAIPIFNCPTRRRSALYPMDWGTTLVANNAGGTNAASGWQVARTDYAINSGTGGNQNGAGPGVGADYYASNGSLAASATAAQNSYFTPSFVQRQTSNFYAYTGVSFEISTVRKDDVTDGLSQTILVGEKYLAESSYGAGNVGADNENMYVGFDNDTNRVTSSLPMMDRWGLDNPTIFGSAHANAANFVLCDGAVISVSYQVNATIFSELGTRAEGVPLDMSAVLGSGG